MVGSKRGISDLPHQCAVEREDRGPLLVVECVDRVATDDDSTDLVELTRSPSTSPEGPDVPSFGIEDPQLLRGLVGHDDATVG